jgi:hypothetical protein
VKQKQDQRRLQNRHSLLASEFLAETIPGTLAEISISFNMGIALPKCGKSSADWGGNRLGRASIGIGTASSGTGRTAPC